MKKIILRLMALIAMTIVVPGSIFAQPPGEGWVKLGDYIKGTYNYDEKDHSYYLPIGKQDFLPIEKIAYKKINEKKQDKSYICIGCRPTFKPTYDGIRERFNDWVYVYNNFKIQEGNGESAKVLKPKDIQIDKDGWSVYSLISLQPAFITNINDVKKGHESNIWDNIYVLPGKLKYFACEENHKKEETEKQRLAEENAAKQKKIAEEKAYQELLTITFTTPANKGLKPVKTETLKDGTVVEYYEGYRFFKKPNGDFATFIENQDERNPKTLDLISGRDKPIPGESLLLGAYQISLPNGLKMKSNGLIETYYFNNSDSLEYIANKNNASATGHVSLAGITYDNFFDPASVTKYTKNAEGDIIYYGHDTAPILLNNYIPLYQSKSEFYIKNNDNNKDHPTIFNFDENGIYQYAIKIGGAYILRTKNKLKKTSSVYYSGYSLWEFENGDYLHNKENEVTSSFHTDNGILIEEINNKIRVTYPNGDRYVGSFLDKIIGRTYYEPLGLDGLINKLNDGETPKYLNGTFTSASGKQIDYIDSKTEAEIKKEEAAQDAAIEQFYKKYGRDNVNSVRFGNIKVGMSIDLIRKYMDISKKSENGSFTWYKVTSNGYKKTNWIIKVNNGTGKVVSITR